ncbi:uncharacterized protein FIBRA_06247 [Fibroporia radiculosa]|uniref:DUF6534 domain-containing protein n=1 Tax=Fibroporia radiculosa TaxID=599839 RepID=J4GAW3_9APHY|nr:uncharacterized protein FIBRA_06247 [Fibroporia radiculosa]CCM04088.1 predicted protein [Fibroporia radiculosa]
MSDLDYNLGPLLIGIVVSTALYGVNCLKVYQYYTTHTKHDGRALKLFVTAVAVLDTLHVVLLTHALYDYSITNFGNYEVDRLMTWSLIVQFLVGSVLATAAQLFFGYRLHRVLSALGKKRHHVPVLICGCSLAQLACAIVYVVNGVRVRRTSNPQIPMTTTVLGLNVMCDMFISVGMLYYPRMIRQVGSRKVRSLADRLQIYNTITFLLPTKLAIAAMIVFLASMYNLVYIPIYFVLIRTYTWSCLSLLNAREHYRGTVFDSMVNTDVDTSTTVLITEKASIAETEGEPAMVRHGNWTFEASAVDPDVSYACPNDFED